MSLNASGCASDLWVLLQGCAALNSDGSPKPMGTQPVGDYALGFATIYNDYAKGGVIAGAMNSGGDASIIEAATRRESALDPADYAMALAQFWSTVGIDPGSPAHGGSSVASVTNNAMAQVGAFLSAIQASMTTEEKKPYYLHYIQNLENAVKSITWQVTEIMPGGSPSTFSVNIE